MKIIKLVLCLLSFLVLSVSPLILTAQNCGYIQLGYNIKINGKDVCVLDNVSRECYSIVDPCPVKTIGG
ncbi:hypothetical protein SAMN04487988_107189 [Algoriphagus hitonicola]|uniref:Uncharacterized protein n=1 Tax=Algoriphagus hitonicola TaxID=435880 RepID=A0A1I2UKD7_9BACT|nr:hypothetical protein SAMN04487988_107189 [Algoriphagus hitonicola]